MSRTLAQILRTGKEHCRGTRTCRKKNLYPDFLNRPSGLRPAPQRRSLFEIPLGNRSKQRTPGSNNTPPAGGLVGPEPTAIGGIILIIWKFRSIVITPRESTEAQKKSTDNKQKNIFVPASVRQKAVRSSLAFFFRRRGTNKAGATCPPSCRVGPHPVAIF